MEFPKRNSVKLVGGNALLHGLQLHTPSMSGTWVNGVLSFRSTKSQLVGTVRKIPFIRGIVIIFYNLFLVLRNKFGWLVFGLAVLLTTLVGDIAVDTKKLLSSESFSPTLWDNFIALLVLILAVIVIIPRMVELFQWHG